MPFSIKERGSRFKFEVTLSKEKNHRDFDGKLHEFKAKLRQVLGDEFRVKAVYSMHDEEETFTVSGPLKEKKTVREIVEKFAAEFFKKSK